jgi:hypothetical protein
VKLSGTPDNFSVNYVATTVPATAQAVNSGTQTPLCAASTCWLTIARSGAATAGTSVGMMFNANKTNGKSGKVPSAAELAAVLVYRVVAGP